MLLSLVGSEMVIRDRPECVEHGVTGYLVGDASERLDIVRLGSVLDEFDRGRCRSRAIERFGRDRMVSDYERLYARAAQARIRSRAPRTARSSKTRLLSNHHEG